ncbi:hypothetical protein CPB83DRAFT_657391 [Crepidotus variabilis]|uniref:Uncharacterized protein n=1 Tax=Crepidotus variabilis TaxID=179855 RepID=A0A9P6JKA0_9AGAR|nr:hypothetical protein CPB83DRAFT_657391 [Crepidotus variabilis]
MCFYPALPFVPGTFVGSIATWRQHSFIVSCLTVTLWDFLEFIPEDVRLFQEFPLKLAYVVYEAARLSTVAWFISNIIHTSNPKVNMSHLYVAFFVLQRGTTSMLFYLRVHALYQSNRYVQISFGLALVAVIVIAGTFFEFSGVACGVFDVCIFFAILWKLGWQPAVQQPRAEAGRSGNRWGFWRPFKRNHVNQVRERFLRDSLLYVLLAILIKIPQIILLVQTNHDWELLTWVACSMYVDIVISSVMSSKIFRDMKLGLPGLSEPSSAAVAPSNSEFRIALSRTKFSSEV